MNSQSLEDQGFLFYIKHEALGKESIEQYDLFPTCEFNHLFNIRFEQNEYKTNLFFIRQVDSRKGDGYGPKQLQWQDIIMSIQRPMEDTEERVQISIIQIQKAW